MKWIYENNTDNTCRFVLGIEGSNPLICVGVNPSTAEPNGLDNTMRSVDRIVKQNKYDGWIMVNLYPQRATDPDDMDALCDYKILEENISHIENLLEKYPNTTMWAAWGTLIKKRKYLKESLKMLKKSTDNHNINWITFADVTKDGHPRHPLYLKILAEKNEFDIDAYLKKL